MGQMLTSWLCMVSVAERAKAVTPEIPSHLEPSGIMHSDGKRPDGATVMPWKSGQTLAWDATCPDTFAPSHVALAAREAGNVASQAERKKLEKYALLGNSHHYVPIVIETFGVFGLEASSFLRELGRQIKADTGEPLSLQFLLRGIVVAVQWGNTAAVLGTAPPTESQTMFYLWCRHSSAISTAHLKSYLLPSRKARQVIVMRCFAWVCMYACISADCAMQFYACVCISATLAQSNPMLTYVCPSCLGNYCAIQWPKCAPGTITAPEYCLACVTRILEEHNHRFFKSLSRSLRIAYNFSNALKIHLTVCRVCCPLNNQIR